MWNLYSRNDVRLSFPTSTFYLKGTSDLVHVDVYGIASITTWNKYKYFLVVIDDKSMFCWIYFLYKNNEVCNLFKQYVSMINTQYGKNLKGFKVKQWWRVCQWRNEVIATHKESSNKHVQKLLNKTKWAIWETNTY